MRTRTLLIISLCAVLFGCGDPNYHDTEQTEQPSAKLQPPAEPGAIPFK